MDVRDLAPALLAIGQLFDAANTVLNRDQATVAINVKATGAGSFEISFDVIQNVVSQITSFFAGEHIVAAVNLKEVLVGGGLGLLWLIRRLRGRSPQKIERLSDSHVRITIDGESFDVPLALVRLYQDLAVRSAAQKVVAEPLRRQGIDTFEVRENRTTRFDHRAKRGRVFRQAGNTARDASRGNTPRGFLDHLSCVQRRQQVAAIRREHPN